METCFVMLTNNDGWLLTVSKKASYRNTPMEHELCRKAEAEVNDAGSEHHKYGPWKIVSSKWG